MLAWLYYKKSLDMYTSLGNKDYEDSKDILSKMPDLKYRFTQVINSKI